MTNAFKIRAGLAVVVAIAIAGMVAFFEFETARQAQLLTEKGQTAVAEVTGASIKSKRKYGVTTRTGEVKYSFTTADGQQIHGSGIVPAALVDGLTDPDDDTVLRDNATVDVLYLPDSPRENNGIKTEMNGHQKPDWMIPLLTLVLVGLGVFVAIGRVMSFFGRNSTA